MTERQTERQTPRTKLRMTRQRRVILEELRKMESHPTADEVFQVVRKRLPKMSLGTVYRNLETMSQSGIIRKLELSGAAKRFDAKIEDHYHVKCVQCGKIDDLPVYPYRVIEDITGKISDYHVFGHSLEVWGLCPECRNHQETPEKSLAKRQRSEQSKTSA